MLHVRRQEQGTADPYFRGAGKVAKVAKMGTKGRGASNLGGVLLAMWEILANFAHDNRAHARLPDKQASIPYFYATDSPSRPDA